MPFGPATFNHPHIMPMHPFAIAQNPSVPASAPKQEGSHRKPRNPQACRRKRAGRFVNDFVAVVDHPTFHSDDLIRAFPAAEPMLTAMEMVVSSHQNKEKFLLRLGSFLHPSLRVSEMGRRIFIKEPSSPQNAEIFSSEPKLAKRQSPLRRRAAPI